MSETGIVRPGFVWTFPGVVDAVIDGDTVIAHVLWRPGEEGSGVHVRLEGINALEIRQKFGPEARAYLAALLPAGTQVTLVARKREKYGRFLSQIILPDGRSAGLEMLTARASDGVTMLALPYNP